LWDKSMRPALQGKHQGTGRGTRCELCSGKKSGDYQTAGKRGKDADYQKGKTDDLKRRIYIGCENEARVKYI